VTLCLLLRFTGSHRLAAASYLHCFSMLSEPHCSVLNTLNACNLREGWSEALAMWIQRVSCSYMGLSADPLLLENLPWLSMTFHDNPLISITIHASLCYSEHLEYAKLWTWQYETMQRTQFQSVPNLAVLSTCLCLAGQVWHGTCWRKSLISEFFCLKLKVVFSSACLS